MLLIISFLISGGMLLLCNNISLNSSMVVLISSATGLNCSGKSCKATFLFTVVFTSLPLTVVVPVIFLIVL